MFKIILNIIGKYLPYNTLIQMNVESIAVYLNKFSLMFFFRFFRANINHESVIKRTRKLNRIENAK